jgi:hypothetical protein
MREKTRGAHVRLGRPHAETSTVGTTHRAPDATTEATT